MNPRKKEEPAVKVKSKMQAVLLALLFMVTILLSAFAKEGEAKIRYASSTLTFGNGSNEGLYEVPVLVLAYYPDENKDGLLDAEIVGGDFEAAMAKGKSLSWDVVTKDLVAHWSFDNCDAIDDSGNGNNGTIQGNPECIAGIKGKTFEFDGADDHVEVTDSPILDINNQITVAHWFKMTTPQIFTFMVSKGISPGTFVWATRVDTPKSLYFDIRTANHGTKAAFFYGSDNLDDGKWHHIAGTFDGLLVKIYLDGFLMATQDIGVADTLATNNEMLTIGSMDNQHYYDGAIDEIRIYNRALHESEIKELYAQGQPWPMFHHDTQHTGRSPYTGPNYNTILWTYNTGGEVNSSPAIDENGTIYVGSEDHNLYALNPDGTLKWTYVTGGGISSSPAIGYNGSIYVGSEDHNLYALNPDGTLKWTYVTGGGISSSPAIGYNGTVYVGSEDHNLYALNPDGTLKCEYNAGGVIHSSPAIGPDGIIYMGSSNENRLHAINQDCTLKWKSDPHVNVIGTSPALSPDGTAEYYGSDDGYLHARNTSDGSLKWKSPWTYGGIQSSPAIGSDGTVYVGTQYGNLWAINPEDGTLKWDYYTTLSAWSSPAIGADGTIYFATDYGHIYAMNLDGTVKWIYEGNYDKDGHFHSSPAIGSNGALYIGSTKGKLYSFAPYTLNIINAGIKGATGTVISSDGAIACETGAVCRKDYNIGTSVTLIATPDLSSVFTGWSGGGCSGTSNCVVTINADTVITATFVLKTYSINASAGEHGSVTPSGTVTVEHGSTLTYAVKPEEGYHISDVLVDGASVGPVATYTFTNITANHTIKVFFGQYQVSGNIRANDSSGILGVVMGGLPSYTITDQNGFYTAKIGPAWSGTITPSKAGYIFSPVSRNVSVPPNRSGVDFVGIPVFSISGQVTDSNGRPLSGVTISSGPEHITTTDNNGYYTLGGLQKGTYILTPYKSGYAFSPISRSISVSSNVTNMNFQAAAIYSVSGRVIDEYGNPVPGAMVLTDNGQSILTDSNGFFTFAVMAGSRTFTISKAGYTFSPFSLVVSADILGLNFKGYDKPPIVMVHGWNSNAEQTFQDGSGPNVPDTLMRAGYHIEFANLQTMMAYTPSLEDNEKGLIEAIDRAKAATGQPKVIIIAHSMGGLVSRAYIEGTRYRGDVSALYTFGSPHLGTPIAVFNYLGNVGGPAIFEMSPLGMFSFNQFYRRRAGVEYHAIGGDAPMDVVIGQICVDFCLTPWGPCWRVTCWDNRVPTWMGGHAADRNFLGWQLGNLIPGQDDAFVSTDSATGLSGLLDRASTDEIHGRPFGDHTYFNNGWSVSSDLSRSYYQCLKKVLVDKTTNTCGRWDYSDRVPVTAAATVGLKALGSSEKSSSQSMGNSLPSLEQHTPIATGTLLARQKKNHTVLIEGGTTAFAAHLASGNVAVTLIDPNGQRIDPEFATSHPDMVKYGADNNTAIYYFRNAIAGKWELQLTGGTGIPTEGSKYTIVTMLHSTLSMSSQMDRDWYAPGDTAHVSALFSEVPSSAKVAATMLYSDGSSNTVILSPNGEGQYKASFAVTDVPGYTQVRLEANGIKADRSPFERSQDLLFQISPHSAVLNGIYRDYPEPRPEEPSLYQALNVTVGINSAINGRIGLSADLVDANRNFVAHSIIIEEITTGASTLILRFSGADIFAAQRNGPYHLTNLLLTDHREASLVISEARDIYITAAYDYRSFAPCRSFPTARAGGPYSVNEGDSITLSAFGNDPENNPLTFEWDLDNDGIFETPGQSVTFSAEGINGPSAYIIRVQVTNSNGFSAIDQTTLDVMNVAPVVYAGSDTTIQAGEIFSRAGFFADPGGKTWIATVDYGDGTGVQPLTLTGTNFELNHLYTEIGIYPVTVTVRDDADGKGEDILTVTVSKIPGDLDGDGVPDEVDACPYSNLSATVVIGNCDTGVSNPVDADGCTIFDRIAKCAIGVKSHGQFSSCVAKLTENLKTDGIITGREKGSIQRCAEQVKIP